MPSWQSAFFARLTRISGLRSFGPDAGIDELRQHYDRLTARFGAVPPDAAFEPAQLGPVKGEWVRVEGAARHRLVLYFHGGGHIAGSPAGHRPLVARLCQAGGANAFSLDYRLAPEFAFPAGLRDGIDAYRHLVNRGVPASTIILAGDGSGGGLAFSCALAIRNAGL
ncbi:MAG: alpha/beta hydrolase, partial [Alphaproteobacteria bacterium]|nr:alpha/beta hydrolase [Alphaproteobacteria bacterium]